MRLHVCIHYQRFSNRTLIVAHITQTTLKLWNIRLHISICLHYSFLDPTSFPCCFSSYVSCWWQKQVYQCSMIDKFMNSVKGAVSCHLAVEDVHIWTAQEQ